MKLFADSREEETKKVAGKEEEAEPEDNVDANEQRNQPQPPKQLNT